MLDKNRESKKNIALGALRAELKRRFDKDETNDLIDLLVMQKSWQEPQPKDLRVQVERDLKQIIWIEFEKQNIDVIKDELLREDIKNALRQEYGLELYDPKKYLT